MQARPTGRTGLWRIGDRDVIVDGSTRFDESKGPAVVGAKVAVVGYKDSNGRSWRCRSRWKAQSQRRYPQPR